MPVKQTDNSGERLQKVLAHAGVAARRACEELIVAGRVTVNGHVVTELGTRVDPLLDRLAVDGKAVDPNFHRMYYLLYKPTGYLTTMSDPHGRQTAASLVPSEARLFPVGRLDMDSEGLLLFTNDGALSLRLMHPRYQHEKEYCVLVVGQVTPQEVQRMHDGLIIEGGTALAHAEVHVMPHNWAWRDYFAPDGCVWVKVLLREGRKRQIRYMFDVLGHEVRRLVRVRMGTLVLGSRLQPGEGRWLADEEAESLRVSVGLERDTVFTRYASKRGHHIAQDNRRPGRPGGVRQEHSRRRTGR